MQFCTAIFYGNNNFAPGFFLNADGFFWEWNQSWQLWNLNLEAEKYPYLNFGPEPYHYCLKRESFLKPGARENVKGLVIPGDKFAYLKRTHPPDIENQCEIFCSSPVRLIS